VERAVTETTTFEEPVFAAAGWYPALPQRHNRLEQGAYAEDKLVTVLGQYHAQTQTERLYDELSFDVYYHTTSDDWTPPSVTGVDSELWAGSASISVAAQDDSGIHAVVIAYTDGRGIWDSVNLTESESAWSGSFPASEDAQFIVQVVDGAGNVAVDDNGGLYFGLDEGVFSTVYLPVVLSD
jgi:hypothetical protein